MNPRLKMPLSADKLNREASFIRVLKPCQLKKLAANFENNKRSQTSPYQKYALYQFKAQNPKKTFTEMAKIFSRRFKAWIALRYIRSPGS